MEVMDDRKPNIMILQENVDETNPSQPQFPKGMAPKMLKLVKVLNDLESKLHPLISKQHHEVLSKLSPSERAKVGLMEVYTINSLYWVLMKTSGENIDATLRDDYKVEMGRLKEAQGKLAELEIRAQRPPVNVRVASRFIRDALGIRRIRESEDVEMEQEFGRPGRQQTWNSHTHNDYQEEGDGAEEYGNQDVEMEQEYVRQGRQQTWNSHTHSDYQEEGDGAEGYENQDDEPQPVAVVRNKKKKKKSALEESQPTHTYYDEDGNCISGSQVEEGEEKKILTSLHTTDSLASDSLSEKNVLKKKKNGKKSIETKGKLKKKKIKSESNATVEDMNGRQVGESYSGTEEPVKGKKKRKDVEEVLEDEEKDPQDLSGEDGDVALSVSNKKKKKKPKKETTINPEDIAAFIDTSRGRINYEFEDNQDLQNKSRSWYEQGWT